MLGSRNLVTFLYARDAERARKFYGDVLGLRFVKQDEYALVFDANGIVLRITILPEYVPTEHPALGWDVADIQETVRGLQAHGILFERYPFLEQDELGIWVAPDGSAQLAWFKDPDGNLLGLSQF